MDDVAEMLVVLARLGVPPDVQELLVYGDPRHGVKPNALMSALTAAGWRKVGPDMVVMKRGTYCERFPACGCKAGLSSMNVCVKDAETKMLKRAAAPPTAFQTDV